MFDWNKLHFCDLSLITLENKMDNIILLRQEPYW